MTDSVGPDVSRSRVAHAMIAVSHRYTEWVERFVAIFRAFAIA
jgi:hypothetical protein